MDNNRWKMHTCCARVELEIPGAVTLKDRCAVVKSLIERLKGRFNLSVSDLDGGEGGASHAVIGISAISNSLEHSGEAINKAIDFIAGDGKAELGSVEIIDI